MSEEIAENKAEIEQVPQTSLVPGFKSVCLRVGLMMIVVFATRCVCNVALSLLRLSPLYYGWSEVGRTLADSLAAIVFLNVIPITAGLFILKFPLKS